MAKRQLALKIGPLIPGMADIKDQTFCFVIQSDVRNFSADENARAAKPSSRSRSGKDSRTDSSSSTTDTSNFSIFTASSLVLLRYRP